MGKHKYIKTPEEMWELFQGYKKQVKENPRIKVDYVGREGDKVETPIERPLTISGFKTYCAYNAGDIQRYWHNVDKKYDEYVTIIARIRNEIRSEQVDGGLTGFYNSNLTARLNNIKEQTETTNSHNVNLLNIDPLADDPTDNSTKKDS